MDLTLITRHKIPQDTGLTPQGTGTKPILGPTDFDNWSRPYRIYGYTAPAGTDASHTCHAVQHRGYLKLPSGGTYTFNIITNLSPNDEVDNNFYIWVRNTAISGNLNPRNSVVRKLFEGERNAQKAYSFVASITDQYVPIRVFYASRLGPDYFKVTITGPGSQPSLVSCSGPEVALKVGCHGNRSESWCKKYRQNKLGPGPRSRLIREIQAAETYSVAAWTIAK